MIKLDSKKANYSYKKFMEVAEEFHIDIDKDLLDEALEEDIAYYSHLKGSNNYKATYCRDNRSNKEFIEEMLLNDRFEELILRIIQKNKLLVKGERLGGSTPAITKEDFKNVNGEADFKLLTNHPPQRHLVELQFCNLLKDSVLIKQHKVNKAKSDYLLLIDNHNKLYCILKRSLINKGALIKHIPQLGNKAGYQIALNNDNIFTFDKECFQIIDAIKGQYYAN